MTPLGWTRDDVECVRFAIDVCLETLLAQQQEFVSLRALCEHVAFLVTGTQRMHVPVQFVEERLQGDICAASLIYTKA